MTQQGLRVLVCGGRDFDNIPLLVQTLNHIHNTRTIKSIIHGAAAGADTLADWWAKARMIPSIAFPANWNEHGNWAGSIRNGRMLRESRPDLVVAFAGHNGTANMIAQAREANVPVFLAR